MNGSRVMNGSVQLTLTVKPTRFSSELQTDTNGVELKETPNAFVMCPTLLKSHTLEIARAQGTSPIS